MIRAFGSLLTASWLAAMALLGPRVPEASGPTGAPAPVEFLHRFHVRSGWRRGESEVARDCRGCHDYANDRDPQAVCASCHYEKFSISSPTQEALRTGLQSLRTAGRAFVHRDHIKMECRACHSAVSGREASARAPAGEPRLMDGGTKTCLDCHDAAAATRHPSAAPREVGPAFVAALDRTFAGRPVGREAAFDHRDHLEATGAHGIADCKACHARLWNPGTLIGENEVDEAACAQCHRADDGAVRVTFGRRDEASAAAGTFPHGPHLSPSALEKVPEFRDRGCLACHTETQPGRIYELDPKFASYETGCVSCHYHNDSRDQANTRWLVRDPSTGVSDHGDVGSCQKCHALGQPAAQFATQRIKVGVTRPRPETFRLAKQSHPFICRGDEKESCRTCHKAGVDVLPSRIEGQKFSHDTHLPREFTDADCLECHRGVDRAATPSDLVLYDVDTDACARCHGKESVVPVYGAAAEPRSVELFSHADHLSEAARRSGQVVGCGSCHQPEQNRADDPARPATDVGVLASARDCTRCHAHNRPGEGPLPDAWKRTGGRAREYVASCVLCHQAVIPEDESKVGDHRVVTRALHGSQVHPSPETQACATCHLTAQPVTLVDSPTQVWAELGYRSGSNGDFHGTGAKPPNCVDCHWPQWADRIVEYARPTTREEAGARATELGNVLGGYPGGK